VEDDNKLYNEEMLVHHERREHKETSVNAAAVKDTNGNLIYIASIQEDITERKEILQKLEGE